MGKFPFRELGRIYLIYYVIHVILIHTTIINIYCSYIFTIPKATIYRQITRQSLIVEPFYRG